ncbi:MAG: hypothetical protein ACLVJ6_08720 [Merdibacter sp.]
MLPHTGITLSGSVSVPIELRQENDFKLLPQDLEKAISERQRSC